MTVILSVTCGHFCCDDSVIKGGRWPELFDACQAAKPVLKLFGTQLTAQGALSVLHKFNWAVLHDGAGDCATQLGPKIGQVAGLSDAVFGDCANLVVGVEERPQIKAEAQNTAAAHVGLDETFAVGAVGPLQEPDFDQLCNMTADGPIGNAVPPEGDRRVRGEDKVVIPFWWQAGQQRIQSGDDGRFQFQGRACPPNCVNQQKPVWRAVVHGQYLTGPPPNGCGYMLKAHVFSRQAQDEAATARHQEICLILANNYRSTESAGLD